MLFNAQHPELGTQCLLFFMQTGLSLPASNGDRTKSPVFKSLCTANKMKWLLGLHFVLPALSCLPQASGINQLAAQFASIGAPKASLDSIRFVMLPCEGLYICMGDAIHPFFCIFFLHAYPPFLFFVDLFCMISFLKCKWGCSTIVCH